jgi:hypothetical protein
MARRMTANQAAKFDAEHIADVAARYKGNPRYAAQVYLREKYRDDYEEFVAFRETDGGTQSGVHMRALQDLMEYYDTKFADVLQTMNDLMR